VKTISAALLALVAVLCLAFYIASLDMANFGIDWQSIRPASLAIVAGESPYGAWYFNPPWLAAMLIPLALLPFQASAALMFAINISAFMAIFARLRIYPVLALILLLIVFRSAFFGNVEGLVLLGAIMPPWIGLFLVLIKPQVGIGIALYWLWFAWKDKRILRTFGPVIFALSLSFIIYGNWLQSNITAQSWNASIFPYGVPFGLLLLWISCKTRNIGGAIAAGVLFSPYVNMWMSWAFLPIGLAIMIPDIVKAQNGRIINFRRLFAFVIRPRFGG
jgi:hypothetical protein